VQRHGPDDVRGAGFLTVGRFCPEDFVKPDEVNRAPSGKERVTFREAPTRSDEDACPEGCVHLVAAPSHKISLLRQLPVRCELCAVEHDGDLAVVCGVDDLLDRRQPSGDVRSRGDGEQPRLWRPAQLSRDVVNREDPFGPALDVAACGNARPRQEIGVVLDDGSDHDVARAQAQAVGEVVDGLGCIAADDRDVVAAFASCEGERRVAGALVRVRRKLGLEAGAAMDSRVGGEELLHATQHRFENAGGRGSIERYIREVLAVDARHEHPVTDQRDGKPRHNPSCPPMPTELNLSCARGADSDARNLQP